MIAITIDYHRFSKFELFDETATGLLSANFKYSLICANYTVIVVFNMLSILYLDFRSILKKIYILKNI